MTPAPPRYSFGSFEFDPAQQQLRSSSGEPVKLPVTLNKLLLLFVSRPGELVTREQIADALWESQGTIDIENGINGVVRRLRGHLAGGAGAEGAGDAPIQTIVGSGYRFSAKVTMVGRQERRVAVPDLPPLAPPLAALDPPPTSFVPPAATRDRNWIRSAALVVALAAFCGLGYAAVHRFLAPGGSAAAPSPGVVPDWVPLTHREVEDGLSAQAISPSGRFVVFSDASGLFVQTLHAQGSHPLEIPANLRVEHLAWFPDERAVLASGVRIAETAAGTKEDASETWMVSTAGGHSMRLLEDAAQAIVSPDGRHLAFTRRHDAEVWIAGPEGDKARRVLAGGAESRVNCLLWSPGSDHLVLDRESTQPQGSAGAEGGALSQLQRQHRFAYESYDTSSGKLLAREADLRFDSGVLTRDARFIYPAHTKDGTLKIWTAAIDPRTSGLVSSPVEGTGKLGENAFNAGSFSASNDAKQISAILERPSTDVYTGELHHGASGSGPPVLENIARLTHHTATALPTAWSPNGDAVIFDEGDSGPSVIARQRLTGGPAEVIADTGGRAVQGQFTPDGRWILFLRYAGQPALVQSVDRVPVGGGRPEVVYASKDILDFRCSRSDRGRCLVRETVGDKQLVYHELDAAGRGKEVARTAWKPHALGDWSLSADGRTVATANHDPVHPGISLIDVASERVGEVVTAATGANEVPIQGFGTVLGATWSVDGRGFFVQTHSTDGYALVYVDRAGHAGTLVKSEEAIWAVPSRDGTKLAFPARTALNRNVWTSVVQ